MCLSLFIIWIILCFLSESSKSRFALVVSPASISASRASMFSLVNTFPAIAKSGHILMGPRNSSVLNPSVHNGMKIRESLLLNQKKNSIQDLRSLSSKRQFCQKRPHISTSSKFRIRHVWVSGWRTMWVTTVFRRHWWRSVRHFPLHIIRPPVPASERM